MRLDVPFQEDLLPGRHRTGRRLRRGQCTDYGSALVEKGFAASEAECTRPVACIMKTVASPRMHIGTAGPRRQWHVLCSSDEHDELVHHVAQFSGNSDFLQSWLPPYSLQGGQRPKDFHLRGDACRLLHHRGPHQWQSRQPGALVPVSFRSEPASRASLHVAAVWSTEHPFFFKSRPGRASPSCWCHGQVLV